MPVKPTLAVILAGDNPSSIIYVNNKKKCAEKLGINSTVITYSSDVKESELLNKVNELNNNKNVTAILVQLPLPEHINQFNIIDAIAPEKDVDGFGPVNLGRLQAGYSSAVVAATPKGVLRLIESTGTDLCGKHAVIIGRSNIVGKPLSSLLLNSDCTVTVTHSKTAGLKDIVRQADILIAACGCPKLVKSDWVKDNAVVIDVGINRTADGKLCGDTDFEALQKRHIRITPVPGGVGPMTVAMLLENTWQAFRHQKENA